MIAPTLSVRGLTKRYGPTVACERVDIDLHPGTIHAVLGENGAGKSTLVKSIYGVVQPDEGAIEWEGARVAIPSPAAARGLGIGMVHQHFALFETMSVAENVALGTGRRVRELRPRIAEMGARLDLPVDPDAPVHALSIGERQRVEILRCLVADPKLLILDEPTAALAPSAVPSLFALLRRLREEGRAIVFIGHKIEEIRALCDRATVMRHGRVVATLDPRDRDANEIATLMIGHEVARTPRPARPTSGAVRLEARALSAPAETRFQTALEGVKLSVCEGEIVGIAGVSGNGQAELVRLLSGERLAPEPGMVRLDGEPVGHHHAGRRRARGLALVPEERLGRGSVPAMTLAANALLTGARSGLARSGFLRRGAMRGFADAVIADGDVRCEGSHARASGLSGGNLQKYILGREMRLAPRTLVVAQPTWGVDVGAAAEVRRRLVALAEGGTAILVVSDELDEILDTAHRLHVMFRGRLSPSVPADAPREALGLAIAGEFAALERPAPARREALHA